MVISLPYEKIFANISKWIWKNLAKMVYSWPYKNIFVNILEQIWK